MKTDAGYTSVASIDRYLVLPRTHRVTTMTSSRFKDNPLVKANYLADEFDMSYDNIVQGNGLLYGH